MITFLLSTLGIFYICTNNKIPFQIRNETPELAIGAAESVREIYEVVTHHLLTSNLRYAVGYT